MHCSVISLIVLAWVVSLFDQIRPILWLFSIFTLITLPIVLRIIVISFLVLPLNLQRFLRIAGIHLWLVLSFYELLYDLFLEYDWRSFDVDDLFHDFFHRAFDYLLDCDRNLYLLDALHKNGLSFFHQFFLHFLNSSHNGGMTAVFCGFQVKQIY